MIVRHFITLTQPWATLMALGWKTIETRSWSTRFRGPIAIHAAKGFPGSCRDLMREDYFHQTLHRAGIHRPQDLPLGRILAVCHLDDCQPTASLIRKISPLELAFGDYSDGRFGFLTSDLRRLKEPLPFKGALGIRPMREPITAESLA